MRAMLLHRIASLADNPEPLVAADIPVPEATGDELLIKVSVCGVCHTELDEIEGRAPPPSLPVVPGHEVVGEVAARGPDARRHAVGDRVGVGWIFDSDGGAAENLSPAFRATGRDANGGYAEFLLVGERYAYAIPAVFSDAEAAPLLCAGGVGYRAFGLSGIRDGQVLGLTGFGGSGHLVLQLVRYLQPRTRVLVFARSPEEREFAMELGAGWAGDVDSAPPERPHAVIDTTPAWRPLLAGLRALRPGGRLIVNAIRKEDTDRHLMATISYHEHLWLEKELKSVANVTSRDIEAFLAVAARIPLKPRVESYPLEAANRALRDLRAGHVRGAKVLMIGDRTQPVASNTVTEASSGNRP